VYGADLWEVRIGKDFGEEVRLACVTCDLLCSRSSIAARDSTIDQIDNDRYYNDDETFHDRPETPE
jgi:hypothetical protein